MKYCLENKTFGFSPDVCLFDSFDEALNALYEVTEIADPKENERIINAVCLYEGCSEFDEIWAITEVRDWDLRNFGMETHIVIQRIPGGVIAIEEESGDTLVEYNF